MEVTCFPEASSSTAQYVIACTKSKKCAILDSVWNFDTVSGRLTSTSCDAILKFVKEKEYKVEWILDTHAHADHLSGAQYLKKQLGADVPYAIGAAITKVQSFFKPIFGLHDSVKEDGSQFDRLWQPDEHFKIGELDVAVLSTPGHTPACVSYYVNSEAVFVGDTLFQPDGGTARCDFPAGSAETLWDSMQRLLALPDSTTVYVCHDYCPGGREFKYSTTIGEERAANIHLAGKTKEQFVELREARDKTLNFPKLLIPSIQVNITAGALPPPDPKSGHTFIKIPVNVL